MMKRLISIIAILALVTTNAFAAFTLNGATISTINGATVTGWNGVTVGGGGADTTAPTVSSATIDITGGNLTLAMSETVNIGAGGNGGFTMLPSTVETFSTATTANWTAPTGVTQVYVEAIGGGGGGANRTSNSVGGGGGGGGAYAAGWVTVTPGNSYSYTVGAAGTGGASPGAGGNSSFNTSSVVAAGGTNATANSATGGSGGTVAASTGTVRHAGGFGHSWSSGTYGAGGGGSGGSAADGNFTSLVNASDNSAGAAVTDGGIGGLGASAAGNGSAPASGPGGGGGGAYRATSGTRNGGAGAAGQIKLTYDTHALTYSSGSGSSSLVYTLANAATPSTTYTYNYTQPGNGVEDVAGNDLVTFTGASITNYAMAAPTGISSTAGNGSIAVTFTAGTGSTSSQIEYDTTSHGTSSGYASNTGTVTSPATISSLTNGTPYYYRVGAVNAGGTIWSAENSQTPTSSSYLVNEQFNTGSAPSGWSVGGTPTYNYTPALEGAYSVEFSGDTQYLFKTFASSSSVYITGMVKAPGGLTGTSTNILWLCSDTSCGTCMGNFHEMSTGAVGPGDLSGTYLNGSTGVWSSTNTYYFKYYYAKGTGSNGVERLWWSSDGTTWTQQSAGITNNAGTANAQCVAINGLAGSGALAIDNIKVSTSDISDAR